MVPKITPVTQMISFLILESPAKVVVIHVSEGEKIIALEAS